jgi:uncharacterized beta-barrel protein YwiB (DUF1934 family)
MVENGKTYVAHIVSEQYDLTELSVLGQAIGSLMQDRSIDGEKLQNMLDEAGFGDIPVSSTYELTTEVSLRMRDGRLCLSYDESEISGMEGTKTEISFSPAKPGLVYILRSGGFRTAFVLENGKRHICTYRTPYMPFEMCVLTKKASNSLTPAGGRLELDYYIEIKGAAVQRMKLSLELRECRA